MQFRELNLVLYLNRHEPAEPSGTIPQFIKGTAPRLRAQQIWKIMVDIAKGVCFIHECQMVHPDVEPSNV